MKKLKIAIGATLHKKVSKHATGGTEVFAYHLAKELIKKGHEVTIFASGDSEVIGHLQGISTEQEINKVEQGQRLFHAYQLMESQEIALKQDQFDIIHINYFEPFLFSPLSKMIKKPVIYTVHSDLFTSKAWQIATQMMVKPSDIFVFVAKHAQEEVTYLKNNTFIYNGVDINEFSFSQEHSDYLLWLGRLRKKKGIKEAVEVAIQSGERLIISGVIDNFEDEEFFKTDVEPLIKTHHNIEFMKDISFTEKVKLYQGAKAFLFPVLWKEPFGLTMIEAMACGTPVIAFNQGAVPEVITNGKTGFIVNNVSEMVEKINEIDSINRIDCRKHVEEQFSLEKMVSHYESLYYSTI